MLNRPKDPSIAISSAVGIFWYDPKEEIVFSFRDDAPFVPNRHINIASQLSHADFWKEVQRVAAPDYDGQDHLSLHKGRVNLVDGRFTVQCPPDFMADEQMRQQVMQDFGIHPLAVEFVGVSQ